jgi:hypothetical protein
VESTMIALDFINPFAIAWRMVSVSISSKISSVIRVLRNFSRREWTISIKV